MKNLLLTELFLKVMKANEMQKDVVYNFKTDFAENNFMIEIIGKKDKSIFAKIGGPVNEICINEISCFIDNLETAQEYMKS